MSSHDPYDAHAPLSEEPDPQPAASAGPPDGRNGRLGRREFVGVLIGLLGLLLLGLRLVWVQAVDPQGRAAAAESDRRRTQVLPAQRGEILDRSGAVLARTLQRYDIAVDQTIVQDQQRLNPDGSVDTLTVLDAIRRLADILRLPDQQVRDALDGDKTFHYLARRITPEQWNAVYELNLGYVTGTPVALRSYPNGSLAGSVIGFVDAEGTASGGIELTQDQVLSGTDGHRTYEISADGVRIPVAPQEEVAAQDGSSVELTLDRDLQFFAQEAIARKVKELEADWGSVVVLRVDDGSVLAMADSTMVDPNDITSTQNPGDYQCRAATASTEPGSTQKLMTASAVIEAGKAEQLGEFTVPGELTIDGQTFTDAFEHGEEHRTLAGIIADSMNTGTVMAGSRLSPQERYDWFRRFGVGSTTGIELPAESPGILVGPDRWDTRQQYTVLFGQGVSQSPLRTVTAAQTLGNDGVRIPPRLVRAVIDPDGTRTEVPRPEPVRVVSSETARQLREMMESVITVGGAPDAAVPGYRVGGKSGTSEAPGEHGGFDGYTTSFSGIGPMEDPQFAVIALLQRPQGGMGRISASPVFAEVMGQVLRSQGVPPSTGGAVGLPKFYGPDRKRNKQLKDTPTGL